MLVLGMLVHLKDTHQIVSNRESGDGRYDVMIIPKNLSHLGIVIEFKIAEKETGESLEKAADLALKQIHDKGYVTEMHARGIKNVLVYGIAFLGKQILVRSERVV